MPKSGARDIALPLCIDAGRAERAADLLKAIAHPIRLRLVALLCDRSYSVTELATMLELRQSIVSQQLGILRNHRLVAAARVGGLAIYRVLEPQLSQMLQCIEGCALP